MQKSSITLKCVSTFISIAVIYFVVASIAFTKSAVIRETPATPTWRWIAEVLAYPSIYLSRWIEAADALLPLMILNSLVWAGAGTLLLLLILRAGR